MTVREPIYVHLTDDGLAGDGSNHDAAVDGSSTAVPLWRGPTEKLWAIHRLIVTIEDNAVLAADNYGGLAALTNGISVKIMSGHHTTGILVLDLLDGDPIKSHVGWAEHCYDMQEHVFGSGNNFVVVRWTFAFAGRPLILDSFDNEKLVITISDNLSTLVAHQFQIQGHVIDGIHEQLNTWGT